MKMPEANFREVDAARRRFLLAARGAGAIGAVAALVGRAAIAEAVAVPAPAEPPTSGYRETEHIRNYYRCARYW